MKGLTDYAQQWIAQQDNLARFAPGGSAVESGFLDQDKLDRLLGIGRHDLVAQVERMASGSLGPAIDARFIAGSHLFDDAVSDLLSAPVDVGSNAAIERILDNQRAIEAYAGDAWVPDVLQKFRLPSDEIIERLTSNLLPLDHTHQFIDTFAAASAVAGVFEMATAIGSLETRVADAFSGITLPDFSHPKAFGLFLDRAGLELPTWSRLPTPDTRRVRIRQRLAANRAPRQNLRAFKLIHQFELVLREVLAAAMAAAYGPDWAQDRLPKCQCNKLIGRSEKNGGEPLLYADYAHYELIVADKEHFDAIFFEAFETPEIARNLINRAGQLRAKSHHPGHGFTEDDERELRLVWRQLEVALGAIFPN